jgi:cytochrome c553
MRHKPVHLFAFLLLVLIGSGVHHGWAASDRGRTLFRLCAACHGNQGEGRLDLAAPAIAGLPEWYVSAQLAKFRDGVRGVHPHDVAGLRMRPMARALPTQDDLAAVAHYVAALPAQPPPPTVAGDIANGERHYLVCQACHGPDGRGNQPLMAPPLVTTHDWYLLTQLQHFKQGVRGADPMRDAAGAMMAPMATALDEQAMRDVIAYIQTLR